MSEDFVWKSSDKFGGRKFGYSWRYPHEAIERYLRSDKIGVAVSVRENGERDADLEPGDSPFEKGSRAGRSKSRRSLRNRSPGLERECRVPGRTSLSMSLLARLSFGPGKKGEEAELRGE